MLGSTKKISKVLGKETVEPGMASLACTPGQEGWIAEDSAP